MELLHRAGRMEDLDPAQQRIPSRTTGHQLLV
jgi:hypothetical protein